MWPLPAHSTSRFTQNLQMERATYPRLPTCTFELQNCGSNFPIVPSNSQVVVQTAFDIKPNQSDGSILGQVIPSDLILCGNTTRTFWKVTAMKNSAQAFTPGRRVSAMDEINGPVPSCFCSTSQSTASSRIASVPEVGVYVFRKGRERLTALLLHGGVSQEDDVAVGVALVQE